MVLRSKQWTKSLRSKLKIKRYGELSSSKPMEAYLTEVGKFWRLAHCVNNEKVVGGLKSDMVGQQGGIIVANFK